MKEKLRLGIAFAMLVLLIPDRSAEAQTSYQLNNQPSATQMQSSAAQVGNWAQWNRSYYVVEVEFLFIGYSNTYWGTRLKTYDKLEALEFYLLASTAKQNGLLHQMFEPQGRWFPVDVRWRKVDWYFQILDAYGIVY